MNHKAQRLLSQSVSQSVLTTPKDSFTLIRSFIVLFFFIPFCFLFASCNTTQSIADSIKKSYNKGKKIRKQCQKLSNYGEDIQQDLLISLVIGKNTNLIDYLRGSTIAPFENFSGLDLEKSNPSKPFNLLFPVACYRVTLYSLSP